MKLHFSRILVTCFCLMILASHGKADTAQVTCEDVFSTTGFQSVDFIRESDTRKLDIILFQLLDTNCTLDQLEFFFVSKGASVDRKTHNRIYLLVTGMTKFLRTGKLMLGTSIIAVVEDGRVTFIKASVNK